MDNITKKIVIGYCVVLMAVLLEVPWVAKFGEMVIGEKYGFVLSSPGPMYSIDFARLFIEVVIITVVAVVVYVMRDRFFSE